MNLKVKLILLFVSVASIAFPESSETATIYTICQRKLCLTYKPTEPFFFGNRIPGYVSGYFEPDEAGLLNVYDSLRDHLYKSLDLSMCAYREYQLDDLVFSFYEYYLQFVPFYKGSKKMIYINAYRRGHDKVDTSDESPATKIVVVSDGGSNFWNIVYDVEEDKFIELDINGHA